MNTEEKIKELENKIYRQDGHIIFLLVMVILLFVIIDILLLKQ